jgi:hypothetical protein
VISRATSGRRIRQAFRRISWQRDAVRWIVLVLGVAALLGAGVFLWSMTRVSESSGSTPPKRDQPAQGAEGSSEAAPATPGVRSPQIKDVLVPQRPPTGESGSDTPAPALVDAGAEYIPVTNTEMKDALRDQLKAIAPQVKECVSRAQKAGVRVSGAANLIVRFTRDKENPVTVGIEPLDTTIKDAQLLDCLAQAGKKIAFQLPEEATWVYATHEIGLDNTALRYHKLTAFQINRGESDAGPP